MSEYDQTYKEQFDLLTFHTDEYKQSIPFIETTLLPKLPQQGHFLDVGAGRGTISMPMSRHFDHTTIVEPNTVYFQEVLDWAKGVGVSLDGHNGDWLEIDSSPIQADLAVLSHVLYFVPYANRSQFVRKAYNCVKRGGYMVIILISATSGINHLYRTLLAPQDYKEMPSIESVVVDLRAEGYDNMHLTMFDADIHLPTVEEMHELMDFLVVDKVAFDNDDMLAKRDQYIRDYLEKESSYNINSNIGVLSIYKQ
ncbi:MAG: class I SAM-dependent methyltransferase [Anaerolineae bacterium]|nr:class I SAM-dependent methyltransferase [Anaerolineae bacterium]MDQ7034487.1 class I SAM-dependent methyltransferase [Anaerolineae bacterium]